MDSSGALSSGVELAFGECEGLCGRMVTFVGWDRYCDECEAEMREEDEADDD